VLQGNGDFRLGEIRYDYDGDNRLKTIGFADGKSITYDYAAGVRLRKIRYSRGELTLNYRSDLAGLSSVSNPDATVTFSYDDPLLESVSWSGQATGTVSFDYDEFLRMSSLQVNELSPIAFGYDEDFQLTSAGDELITRHPVTGFVSGTALGAVTTDDTYNAFGELDESFALFDATVLLNQEIERDKRGRITKITETKQSPTELGEMETIEYEFTYDELGQVVSAAIDGVTSEYTYDVNGNRTSETVDAVKVQSFADFQDRI
jgi:hypothetical protein